LSNKFFFLCCCLFSCSFSYSQFRGGSYDGFAFDSVACPIVILFTGGSYDGFAFDTAACPASAPASGSAPFIGGPYNGFSFVGVSCTVESAQFSGGSYDGFSSLTVSCPPQSNFYGGSYGGFDYVDISCAVVNHFAGGPYGGFSYDSIACPASPPAAGTVPFIGGSYDGFDFASISCPPVILFTGGSYDGFAFSAIACPDETALPLELLSFSGKRVSDYVELEWITVSEFNTSHFDVEKMNENGVFENIDVVPAAGFHSQKKIYNSEDEQPHTGYNFYRLKMFDLDGSFTYSNTVSVYFDWLSDYSISFYPNPATEWVNVHVSGLKEDQIVLSIYDMLGRKYFSQDWFINSTDGDLRLDVSSLSVGVYMIIVNGLRQQYFVPNKLVKLN